MTLLTGVSHAAEQGLEEVRGEFLIGVTIWGPKLVKHPHQLLQACAVFVCDRACGLEEDIGGPLVRRGKFEGKVIRGGEGKVMVSRGARVGIGDGGGGCVGGLVVVLVRIVVAGGRGEVVIVHVNVEAFFVRVILG